MLKETLLKFFKLDGLVDNLTGYLETRVELMKYEIKEDLVRGIAKLALLIVVGSFFGLFIAFASVALALLLARSIGVIGGFGVVGGFYLLLTVMLILFRNEIRKKLEQQLKDILKDK